MRRADRKRAGRRGRDASGSGGAPEVPPGNAPVPASRPLPSTLGWPHLHVLHAPGWRPVVPYPVRAPELPPSAGLDLVRRRLEALSNPPRTMICRSLARAPYTNGELAEAKGPSAPEVSRHPAVLRKAGLLTTWRRGRYVRNRLDLTATARLGSDLLEVVLH